MVLDVYTPCVCTVIKFIENTVKFVLYLLYNPANISRWPDAGLLLGQRRRRWSNSKPAFEPTCLLGTTLAISGPLIILISRHLLSYCIIMSNYVILPHKI